MLINALVSGLKSDSIRQRILETIDVSNDQALATAKSLELAYDNNGKYKGYRGTACVVAPVENLIHNDDARCHVKRAPTAT